MQALLDYIVNESEGGRLLKEKGLAESADANDGTLFVPAYDVEFFAGREMFGRHRAKYEIHEIVRAGSRTLVDRRFVPRSIEAALRIPRRGEDSYVDENGKNAMRVREIFRNDVARAVAALCKKGKILRGEGVGIFRPVTGALRELGDSYPYIIGRRQLESVELKEQMLEVLGIGRTVGVCTITRRGSAMEMRYGRREFLERGADRILVRWHGDLAIPYGFAVCGIPWQ